MNKKANEGKKRKRKFKIRHLLLFLFIIYICSTLYNQRVMINGLKKEKASTEKDMEELKSDIDRINTEIKNKDSLKFIEKTAREEFRMVKPREIIYIDKNKNKNPFLMKGDN
ncbi:FtsB family cell division protein [Anaerosalibacter massiliensis]|uniref:Septum formation initiator family protein n=1 Tax=Anaerosalibacter massiliensis TaxID=1347392 RepID=A0A9X2MIU8_9FIRM|nr:septum formation initiator family protein [Anaerosalibacter massiliensis]MCR2043900.1 septum formation initiator family protein [Anaerosalibacter massiliensis]